MASAVANLILGSKPTDLHFGYLNFSFFARETLIAGLLVVDEHGFPVDFRFCKAVKPNPLQRTLYGDSLEPYLIESVTKELFSDLTGTPVICFSNYRFPFPSEALPYPVSLMKMVDEELFLEALNQIPCKMEISEIEEAIDFQLYEPSERVEQALNMIRQEGPESNKESQEQATS